jgi:hypothetical protein
MDTLFIDKRVGRFLFVSMTVILAIIAVAKIGLSLFRIEVNADAAFYLGVSRLILEGNLPFVDFPPIYTPLSFYMMSVPIALFGTSFTIALLFFYLLHLANAGIVYKIVRQYSCDKLLAAFCAIFSLLLCLGSDGCRYVLEPFVLFFGLSALCVLKRRGLKWIVISGFFCFCSFWSKQYGLGFICLAVAFLFLEEGCSKTFVRKLCYLLMGFFVGMAIFVLFFLLQGVEPLALLGLSGSDYRRVGISGLIGGWTSLFITLPILIIAIMVMIAKLQNFRKISLLIISFLAVFGFMLQCYVRFYAHYLILAMPFCVLMLFACMDAIKSIKWKNIYTVLLLLAPFIPIYFASKSMISLIGENTRVKQEICAKSLSKIVPVGSKDVYCAMDLLPFMHINTYNPPLVSKFGMSNGFIEEAEGTSDLIRAASYCMISERDLKKTKRYTTEICDYLNKNFDRTQIEGIASPNEYYIYVRKK